MSESLTIWRACIPPLIDTSLRERLVVGWWALLLPALFCGCGGSVTDSVSEKETVDPGSTATPRHGVVCDSFDLIASIDGSGLTMRANMRTTWSKVWVSLVLLVVTAARGETLYERDGITLEGTVRMVDRDAATCQVREDDAHHAGNNGKPLHVWRLDYGAFNWSGNPLSQLTAHFQIEAEWPPCTNWTGLGQYPGPVQWVGSFETLQRTGGLEAGGEARETLYVLAIDGQQPRFFALAARLPVRRDSRFERAGTGEPASAGTAARSPATRLRRHFRPVGRPALLARAGKSSGLLRVEHELHAA